MSFGRLRVVINSLERLQNRNAVREHFVGEQKRVEKVDGQKSQISESFQQAFGSRVSHSRNLRPTKARRQINNSLIRADTTYEYENRANEKKATSRGKKIKDQK